MRPCIACEHGLGLMKLAGFSSFYFPHGPPTTFPILDHTLESSFGQVLKERTRRRGQGLRERLRGGRDPAGLGPSEWADARDPPHLPGTCELEDAN